MKKARTGSKLKLLIPQTRTLFVFNRNIKNHGPDEAEVSVGQDQPKNSSRNDRDVFFIELKVPLTG